MSKARKAEGVHVTLLATYSGDGESWAPGEAITVDAAEAERLIGLGAAVSAADDADPQPEAES